MVGTTEGDALCGEDGNDTIPGRGGSDVLDCGDGYHTVLFVGGQDRVADDRENRNP